jgi:hypothetical protein
MISMLKIAVLSSKGKDFYQDTDHDTAPTDLPKPITSSRLQRGVLDVSYGFGIFLSTNGCKRIGDN